MPPYSRRHFIQRCCAAVGATGMLSAMSQLRLLGAAATGAAENDYKALVCIFLSGGNDNSNFIIPYDLGGHQAYAQTRGALALPREGLLGINPATTDGREWALHPSLPHLRDLFAAGRIAVVANVGTLAAPTTRAQYLARSVPLPRQLFSHSDQALQWQTGVPDRLSLTGWGGRLADLTQAFNENDQISMSISLAGNNSFQVGEQITQLAVSPDGAPTLRQHEDPANDLASIRLAALRQMFRNSDPNLFRTAFGDASDRALENSQLLGEALASVPAPTTTFPDSQLGRQLRMIAHLIAARDQLGLKRQVFFAEMEGFDMHAFLLEPHQTLLAQLSAAMKAFHDETVAIGMQEQVTTFTASDFGRTLVINGQGSDHGWGSHHMVMGGAVRGGDFYGAIPDLTLDGPDDTEHGRWIPTISVDEYAATLARWFGVSESDLPLVFPNIGRFASSDLGFLNF